MEQAVHLTERPQVRTDAVDSPEQNFSQPVSPEGADRATAAKEYARIRLALGLGSTFFFYLFMLVLVLSGATSGLERFVRSILPNDYAALLGFFLLLGIAEMIVSFPLSYISGFYLEHRYHLSNQSFRGWMWEGLKGLLISVPLVVVVLVGLYYSLRSFGVFWWLPVGSILFLLSVVLARIAPILIFPLFNKFQPLPDGDLKSALLQLCQRVGMSVGGVFVFDMSKNTKKANAAFAGIGKSKRIILGDTLLANFRDPEIEAIFAHELGHSRLKHLRRMLIAGTVSSFLGLYCTAQLYQISLSWFGFTAPDQLAALPLLALWLGLYSLITNPLTNMVSRSHERAADRFAVTLTNDPGSFASALRKLAVMNLADVAPHPLVEFLFHSHPSIEKRIRALEKSKEAPGATG